MMRLLLLSCLLLPAPAWGATYHLRADGTVTAANKNNATGCGAASTAMSIAEHNAATFAAGDVINVCDSGGTYRATLIPPSSGAADNWITYKGVGSPVISGADVVTGWSDQGSNVWSATVTAQPNLVFFSGTKGTLVANQAAVTSIGKWFWSANTLYVYATASPTGIEAASRSFVVTDNGQKRQYIRYDNLTLTQGNSSFWGLFSVQNSSSNNLTIQNSRLTDSYGSGVLSTGKYINVLNSIISGNVCTNASAAGIYIHDTWQYGTIAGNQIFDNGRFGIQVLTTKLKNISILNNEIHHNLWTGLHLYSQDSINHTTALTIRYNLIHDNGITTGAYIGGGGLPDSANVSEVYIQLLDGNDISYNKIYNARIGNGMNTGGDLLWLFGSSENTISHNVLFNSLSTVSEGLAVAIECSNNAFGVGEPVCLVHSKNNLLTYNIFLANRINVGFTVNETELRGNTFNHNVYYGGVNGAVNLGSTRTLAQWQTFSGQDASSVAVDPQFISTATDKENFFFQDSSPIKAYGINISGSLKDGAVAHGGAAIK